VHLVAGPEGPGPNTDCVKTRCKFMELLNLGQLQSAGMGDAYLVHGKQMQRVSVSTQSE